MKQQVRYGAETRGRVVNGGGVLQEGGRVYLCGDFAASVFRLSTELLPYQALVFEGGKGKACPEEGERRTIQLEERNARKLYRVWTSC